MINLIEPLNLTITIISIIVNVVIFIIWLRKAIEYLCNTRYLKKIFGLINNEMIIRISVFEDFSDLHWKVVTYEAVKSIKIIGDLLSKCNLKYDMLPENKLENADEILIGGPLANKEVSNYMSTHFKRFKQVTKVSSVEAFKKSFINPDFLEASEEYHGFRIYDKSMENVMHYFKLDRNLKDYAFLIKFEEEVNGIKRMVHILFGGYNTGTYLATIFLKKHYREIYKKHKSGSYFIAVAINRNTETFDLSPNGVIDLTDEMFD